MTGCKSRVVVWYPEQCDIAMDHKTLPGTLGCVTGAYAHELSKIPGILSYKTLTISARSFLHLVPANRSFSTARILWTTEIFSGEEDGRAGFICGKKCAIIYMSIQCLIRYNFYTTMSFTMQKKENTFTTKSMSKCDFVTNGEVKLIGFQHYSSIICIIFILK